MSLANSIVRLLVRGLPVFSAVVALNSTAVASPVFPQAVKDHLPGLSCVPQCTLCHSANPGLAGTAIGEPFGGAILRGGAIIGDAESIGPALDKLLAQGVAADVDKDGVNDVEQIEKFNTNPNQNGEDVCGPTYGCGAHIEPTGSFSWGALLAGGVLSVVGLARIRARRR